MTTFPQLKSSPQTQGAEKNHNRIGPSPLSWHQNRRKMIDKQFLSAPQPLYWVNENTLGWTKKGVYRKKGLTAKGIPPYVAPGSEKHHANKYDIYCDVRGLVVAPHVRLRGLPDRLIHTRLS